MSSTRHIVNRSNNAKVCEALARSRHDATALPSGGHETPPTFIVAQRRA